MGRRRSNKRKDGDKAECQRPKFEQEVDPIIRLVTVHPAASWLVVAVNTRVVAINTSTSECKDINEVAGAKGHTAPVRALQFSSDGKFLVTGATDKTAKLWDSQSWECIATWKTPKKISAATFTHDSSYVLFADKFGDVLCGRCEPAEGLQEPSLVLGHCCSIVTSMSVSADNKYIASCDKDAHIRVSLLPADPARGAPEVQSFCLGHTAFTTSCHLIQQAGQPLLLVSGAGDGTVRLWDPMAGKLLDTYTAAKSARSDANTPEPEGEQSDEGDEEQSGEGDEQNGQADTAGQEGGDDDNFGAFAGGDCDPVIDVAVSQDGKLCAVLVEGQHDVQLLRIDAEANKLHLHQRLELPRVRYPCQACFDGAGMLYVVGGAPLQTSNTVHLGIARPSETQHYEPAESVLTQEALQQIEQRSEEEEAQMKEGGSLVSYSRHLKRKQHTAEERERRKRVRNDKKESERLALLHKQDVQASEPQQQ